MTKAIEMEGMWHSKLCDEFNDKHISDILLLIHESESFKILLIEKTGKSCHMKCGSLGTFANFYFFFIGDLVNMSY